MAYKLNFDGLDDVQKMMETIANKSVPIAKQMVYVGADQIADAVRASLESAVSSNATGRLADSLKLTKMRTATDGAFNNQTFIGYDPETHQPFAVIASVLESGRSDQPGRNATHFYSKAVRSAKAKAETEMQDKFDEIIDKITKEK